MSSLTILFILTIDNNAQNMPFHPGNKVPYLGRTLINLNDVISGLFSIIYHLTLSISNVNLYIFNQNFLNSMLNNKEKTIKSVLLFFVLLFRIPARVKATKKGNNIQTRAPKNDTWQKQRLFLFYTNTHKIFDYKDNCLPGGV